MTAVTGTEPSADGRRFRPDIEGMRAVAVGLVLLHHAGAEVVPGGFAGVDVFFVISGFVITTQLLRELDATGRVDLLAFYGRRAKRLLPAAGLVLLTTALASWLLVSRVQWSQIAGDIIGAAVYVVNWVFAARSVDYLAEDVEPSPVLHYWSLAVEEQFYVIWPVLILALAWSARRLRRGSRGPRRGLLALGLTLVIVLPSLGWSVWYTAQAPEQAFFVTPTRLWELGVGALVALGTGAWGRLGPAGGAALAWAGLATVVAGALVQSAETAWPGAAALVPTLGTAAVIAGGFRAARWGPEVLLGRRCLVWVGGLSYSLYLWHWPVLRAAEWTWGEVGTPVGLVLMTVSVVPAWLSYRFLEQPIRRSPGLVRSPGFAISVALNSTLLALTAGLVLSHAATTRATGAADVADVGWGRLDGGSATAAPGTGDGDDDGPTAAPAPTPPRRASPDDPPVFEVITPDPVDATDDVPTMYESGCQTTLGDDTVRVCQEGDPDGELLVAVVGDSKMGQWVPALDAIARENGWRMPVYTKSACAFTDAMTVKGGEPYESCRAWGEEVMERLSGEERPDVLITSALRGTALDEAGELTEEAMVEGYRSTWTALADAGVRIVALSDTPTPPLDEPVYQCVADNPDSHREVCSWEAKDGFGTSALRTAVQEVPGATFINLDPWVCPEGECVGVYRNVLTYRQGSHLTATFVQLLAEPLAQLLVPVVER